MVQKKIIRLLIHIIPFCKVIILLVMQTERGQQIHSRIEIRHTLRDITYILVRNGSHDKWRKCFNDERSHARCLLELPNEYSEYVSTLLLVVWLGIQE